MKTTLYGANSRLGMVIRTGTSLRASADKQCPQCGKDMLVWEWLSGMCETCLETYSRDYRQTSAHCTCFLNDGEYGSRGYHYRPTPDGPVIFQRCYKYWEAAGYRITTHPELGPGWGLVGVGVIEKRTKAKDLRRDLVQKERVPKQTGLV